jgi:hypothetical protein
VWIKLKPMCPQRERDRETEREPASTVTASARLAS